MFRPLYNIEEWKAKLDELVADALYDEAWVKAEFKRIEKYRTLPQNPTTTAITKAIIAEIKRIEKEKDND